MLDRVRPKLVRCAIYTRKSSEEGLEQDFNSLHAQREACEAYVLSQRHEGWTALAHSYDDGGVSGGTIERPALQRLLSDVRSGQIDVIVVYKVDRLTRALSDFARIVEIFDRHRVSFVSVTQQFNTTSSMGRLTLNVLLSFAQFEREVTGERIRDKIAASKKKGMWMGGFVPLGYEAKERTLVINEAEAETVCTLFALYLRLGNVREVKHEADRLGLRTKRLVATSGRVCGGLPFSRGHIYRLLSCALYLGEIPHRGQRFAGRHTAIIDQVTWDGVQALLAANTHERRAGGVARERSLLTGLLFDLEGRRFTPTHTTRNGKRHRYYVSHAKAGSREGSRAPLRLPAREIEAMVLGAMRQLLEDQPRLLDLFGLSGLVPDRQRDLLARADELNATFASSSAAAHAPALRALVQSIAVSETMLYIRLRTEWCAGLDPHRTLPELAVPIVLKKRGLQTLLRIQSAAERRDKRSDPALVKAIARGHVWFDEIARGVVLSLAEIARREGINERYVGCLIKLAFLAPDLVESVLNRDQPADLSTKRLTMDGELPLLWSEQRKDVIARGSTARTGDALLRRPRSEARVPRQRLRCEQQEGRGDRALPGPP